MTSHHPYSKKSNSLFSLIKSHHPHGTFILAGITSIVLSAVYVRACSERPIIRDATEPKIASLGNSEHYVVDDLGNPLSGPFEEIRSDKGKFYGIIKPCKYELNYQGVVDADKLSAICKDKLNY